MCSILPHSFSLVFPQYLLLNCAVRRVAIWRVIALLLCYNNGIVGKHLYLNGWYLLLCIPFSFHLTCPRRRGALLGISFTQDCEWAEIGLPVLWAFAQLHSLTLCFLALVNFAYKNSFSSILTRIKYIKTAKKKKKTCKKK